MHSTLTRESDFRVGVSRAISSCAYLRRLPGVATADRDDAGHSLRPSISLVCRIDGLMTEHRGYIYTTFVLTKYLPDAS